MNKKLTNKSQMMITPLPKITVQRQGWRENIKVDHMIKKLGRKRQLEIVQERSQGFWIEDQVKHSLDRITMRANRLKTISEAQLNCDMVSQIQRSRKNRRKTTLGKFNSFFNKEKKNLCYLPQVQQINITRNQYSNSLIKAKRQKIIHLLILGLNRRSLGKLIQALDIILLASYYFEKDDNEIQLKTICLNLISKLYKQIASHRIKQPRKSKQLKKKRKSLSVVNYWSRQNFTQNFMQKLRKTKLVGEFSYSDNKQHKDNLKRINAKCDVMIPKPQQVFGSQSGINNYDYVVITVDDYTNMFPYQYPKTLNQKIKVEDYRFIISKLNGLLFPESKCYSLESILKIFYLPFLLIFLLMLSFTCLRTMITQDIARYILIGIVLSCLFLLAIKINCQESGYTNYIEIKDKMRGYLDDWQVKYSHLDIKFRMGQNVDAVFIVFPSQIPDSSSSSSNLTQIQEVDENYTDNATQSKYKNLDSKAQVGFDNQSMRNWRRAGNCFDENGGNIMKKRTISRFASLGKNSVKKQKQTAEKYNSCINQINNNQNDKSNKFENNQQRNQNETQMLSSIFGNSQIQSQILSQKVVEQNIENGQKLQIAKYIKKHQTKQAQYSEINNQYHKISDISNIQKNIDYTAKSINNIINEEQKQIKCINQYQKETLLQISRKKSTKRTAQTFCENISNKLRVDSGKFIQNPLEDKNKKYNSIPQKGAHRNQISSSTLFTPQSGTETCQLKQFQINQKRISQYNQAKNLADNQNKTIFNS